MNQYDVQLVAESGEQVLYRFSCAWGADWITDESIGRSAAAQASVEARKKYLPIRVTKV